jgi:hypothetical protein
LLIVNDHYLKEAYGNWLTGKLSDFAGLFAFAVVAQVAWRRLASVRWSAFPGGVLLAGLFFSWFKSPLSGVALEAVNALSGRSFGRVIDYSDLAALVVLLPAMWLVKKRLESKVRVLPEWSLVVTLPVALLAFVATSDDDVFPSSPVAFCCDTGPQVVSVGTGTLYVPTAFTPDGDGLNDIFQVGVDSNIQQLDSIVIFNNYEAEAVYRKYNVTDFSPQAGFDGSTLDSLPPQEFYYVIGVTSVDSASEVVYGQVCALPCREPTSLLLPLLADSCAYGNQFTPTGGYDSLIVSGEFLECFQQ